MVFNLADRKCEIKRAHRLSAVTGLEWLKEDVLLSTGADGTIKQWKIEFK